MRKEKAPGPTAAAVRMAARNFEKTDRDRGINSHFNIGWICTQWLQKV